MKRVITNEICILEKDTVDWIKISAYNYIWGVGWTIDDCRNRTETEGDGNEPLG